MRKIAFAIAAALTGLLTAEMPCLAAGGQSVEKTAAKSKNKNDKNKNDDHVVATSPSYIGIDPIYTTILDGDNIGGLLMVGIGLDIPDEHLRAEVVRIMPSLRDLYVRSMLSFTAANVRPWRQPDPVAIADKLQKVTDYRLKRKGVKVLLAQVAIRLNH
jgi:flagellar basal body-associated protein FliL